VDVLTKWWEREKLHHRQPAERGGNIRKLFVILMLAATVTGYAETIHITEIHVHIRDKNEPSFSSALHTRQYTGTIGNRKFTLEEAITALARPSRFEVGKDYEVVKVEDRIGKTMKVKEEPDKKGRVQTEWLTVVSVEEVSK